jgi:hypothetical protein
MEGLQRKNSHININMNPYSNENKSNLLHKRRFSKQDLNSGL